MIQSRSPSFGLSILGVITCACCFFCACQPQADPRTDQPVATPLPERPNIDNEPNDTPNEASDLADGGAGHLEPTDVDYYRLHRSPPVWQLEALSTRSDALRVDLVDRDGELPDSLVPEGTISAARSDAGVLLAVRPLSGEPVDYVLTVTAFGEDVTNLAVEPNDREQPFWVTTAPFRMTGFFDQEDDADAAVVAVEDWDGPMSIELAPLPGLQLGLRVYSGDEKLDETISQRIGVGVGIPNLRVDSERQVTVEVFAVNGRTHQPYSLLFHRPDLPEPVELEPNGTTNRAERVVLERVTHGVFHRPDDVDVFRVQSSQTMTHSITVTASTGVDVAARWMPDGGPVFGLDRAGVGDDEVFCGLHADGGTHHLEVAANSTDSLALPSYTIEIGGIAGPGESEPNDNFGSNSVELQEQIQGYAFPTGDIDTFAFHVGVSPIDRPPTFRFRLQSPAEVDLDFDVQEDNGDLLTRGNGAGAGEEERRDVALTQGDFRIVVVAASGASCAESYRLSVEQLN